MGLKGRALQHMDMKSEEDGETIYTPSREPGWKPAYNDLWFEYMTEKGGKGVSKDTWMMVCPFSLLLWGSTHRFVQFFDFVRTIDEKFEKYDPDGTSCACYLILSLMYSTLLAAWPSAIDDFAEWAKERLDQQ